MEIWHDAILSNSGTTMYFKQVFKSYRCIKAVLYDIV